MILSIADCKRLSSDATHAVIYRVVFFLKISWQIKHSSVKICQRNKLNQNTHITLSLANILVTKLSGAN